MASPMPRKTNDSAPFKNGTKQAIDPVALSHALSDAMERALPMIQDYMERQGKNTGYETLEPLMLLQERFSSFLGVLMSNPRRLAELQFEYWQNWATLWQNSFSRMNGEQTEALYKPEPGDRRFRSEDWNENVLFDFIKQSYLMTSNWMHRVVVSAEGLDPDVMEQVDFYTRQFADAMAPTNFVLTNPDVLRETIRSGGENLVLGLENMMQDMERGNGELKISTTDYEGFVPGENLAVTKGSVVFQNDLIQLIQYTPTTDTVAKKPLLVVPPWINKYYILDLRPENSFVKWLVGQGHTVFMISWVNPGAQHADKGFEQYMHEGVLASLDHMKKVTGEPDANVIAYCLGGTLLTITLAWLKEKGMDNRIASCAFLTTLIDFSKAGELKLFTSKKQIEAMEATMKRDGVLSGDYLQKTFAILRANDMIWSFVINNYLMGKEPFPFDLLYWNEDSTNMPAAMHSYYLRNMYLENKLIEPEGLDVDGVKIDVRTIDTPAYFLSTREDHIAPWKATYAGYSVFSGPKKFTLSASGHVAGVVNHPDAEKYCYWSSSENTSSPDKWLSHATESKGSWWTDWQKWVTTYSGGPSPARIPSKAIEAAPGSYVRKQAE